MNGLFQATLIKKDGKLSFTVSGDDTQQKEFVKNLEEGVEVILYMEVLENNHSLSQLSKVHKCIRVLAAHTGNTFTEMKDEVKRRCGMLIESEGVKVEVSFGKISKEDLNLAVQAAIEIGDEVGVNLR